MMDFSRLGINLPATGEPTEARQGFRTSTWNEIPRRSFSAKGGVPNLRGLYKDLDLPSLHSNNPALTGSKKAALEPLAYTSGETESQTARGGNFLDTSPQTRGPTDQHTRGLFAQHSSNTPTQLTRGLERTGAFASDFPHRMPTFVHASLTRLPPSTSEEDAFLQYRSPTSPMMEEELEEGHFHESPLEVDHGVAMLEESVELGVADVNVIAQA